MERMIKSQDIFILLVLLRDTLGEWTYDTLSAHVGVAKSEVYRSIKRSASSHLFDLQSRRVRKAELLEFIAHGIRYAFAVAPGNSVRGMPTAWNAPGLEEHLMTDELERFVWPHPRGTMRGRAIEPFHDAVIAAAAQDEELHRQLALCDAIRLGSARERKLAATLLTEALKS